MPQIPADAACTSYPLAGSLAGWRYTPAPAAQIVGLTAFLPLDGSLALYDPATLLPFSRAPLRPAGSLAFRQASRQSTGAVRFGFDWYVRDALFALPLRLSEAEKTTFLTFWRTTVRGMSAPFTYLDPEGTALAVRFAAATLPQIREVAYDAYEVTVSLRVQ